MPVLAAATTPDQLDAVTREACEWWFEPRSITNSVPGGLQIPLSLATGLVERLPTRWLRIRHVKHHTLTPAPSAPAYDIDQLEYQPASHRLVIRTVVPLDFEIEVDALDVDVMEPSPG